DHPRRYLEDDRGIVEDGPDAPGDHLVGYLLGDGGWHGDDADPDPFAADGLGDLVVRQDGQVADLLADPLRLAVEEGDDVEGRGAETAVADDRPPQISQPGQGDVPLLVEPQDLCDGVGQEGGVVALALLAEAAEIGEVA